MRVVCAGEKEIYEIISERILNTAKVVDKRFVIGADRGCELMRAVIN